MTQRAMIYARVSLDQTGEGRSVARQLAACQSLSDARGYEVVGTESDSQSAYSDRKRPGWERVKAAAEAGEIDVIVAWQLDRVTRSINELEQLIELTERTGVGVATVSGEMDLTTSNGRMLARILGAVARAEVEMKASRQKAANLDRAKRGEPFRAGPTLFGYDTDGNLVEAEAEAIRQAAEDVLHGASVYSIMKRWNEAGLEPRATRRKGPGGWTKAGVKLLLVNPRLAGHSTYRGEVVGQGDWEPVLDAGTHAALVALLTDPARNVGSVKVGPKASTLLSGIALCSACGATMTAGSNRGRLVYSCRNHHTQVRRVQADMQVQVEVVKNLVQATELGIFKIDEPGTVDVAQVDALTARLDELADAYARGTISLAQLETGSVTLRERIAEAQTVESTSRTLTTEEATKMFMDASLEGQRAMLANAFAITVQVAGKGARLPIWERVLIEPKALRDA